MSRHGRVERAEPSAPSSTPSAARHGAHEHQQRADASERVVAQTARIQALADASRSPGAAGSDATIQQRALPGLRGQAVALPHRERIQASFGRHDVSHVRAHLDAPARASCAAIGVQAFASGEQVAFARAPSLFVAAHEAAHVVQQRSGIQLFGGVGRAGDVFEQHADEVASKVVRGESASALLDRHAGPRAGEGARVQPLVQCWGEPDHYAMGQLAGVKAITELGRHEPISPASYRLGDAEDATIKPRLLRRGADDSVVHGRLDAHDAFVLRDDDGNPISYGAANRIGGDLSGQPLGKGGRAPSLAEWPARLAKARAEALAKTKPKSKASKTHSLFVDEDEAPELPSDYAPLGKFGEYTLLATNANHFFPLARVEYQRQHQRAKQKMWMAIQLRTSKPKLAEHLAREAMLVEGFAGHFLADCFAAGHLSPHALGRIDHAAMLDTGALVNTWHDLFNALPDGIPTTLGRFHGDYSMDGGDLEYVSSVLANSLLEIVMPWFTGERFDPEIVLPEPDLPKIIADPVAGPLWAAMCKDYQPFLTKLVGLDRRKGKSGLSKYTIYSSTTGEQVSNEEAITPILEKTFGGQLSGPERVLSDNDVARVRGRVLKIVEALAHLLDYRGGWQPATGLAKDFEPLDTAPDVYKFRPDLKSAALASKSDATSPIVPLLADLDTWLVIWGQLAGVLETPEEVKLRDDVGKLLGLGLAAKQPKDFEKRRAAFLNHAKACARELATLELVVDASAPRYEQGPGSTSRHGAALSQLYREFRDVHGDDATDLTPLRHEIAKLPKTQLTASGQVIRSKVPIMRSLWDGRRDALQPLVRLRAALEALCADPRPEHEGEHRLVYDLVTHACEDLVGALATTVKSPDSELALEHWCEALQGSLADWFKLGTGKGKRNETARREVLAALSVLLGKDDSPFTFDAEQLYRASGRVLASKAVRDAEEAGLPTSDIEYIEL